MTKIIVKSKYMLALKNPDRIKKFDNRDKKYISNMLNYFSDDKKRALNMIDYFTGKINKHENLNLILENGHSATEKEKNKRTKQILKQFDNSNLWQLVISFDKKYIDKNISWEDLQKEVVKYILPKFFKKLDFIDSNKMMYELSFHTNTKNPHFHISFMEREPNYKNTRGKMIYKRKGNVSKEALNYLKNEIELTVERNNHFKPLSKSINKDIEELKKMFNSTSRNFILNNKRNIFLEEKILNLGKLLNERINSTNNRIKFNSIKDEEIKRLTKEIKNDLFSVNKNLNISKVSFNNSIKNMNNYLLKITKDNGINIKDVDYSYTKSKEEYLENYINNAIVNHARYDYSKNKSVIVNPDDVIQSIVYQTYLDNQSHDRKLIILNSFNNSYPIQYEVDNAIRKINRNQKYICEEVYRKIIKKNNINKKTL